MADWTTDPFYLEMIAQIQSKPKPKPKPKPRPKSKAGAAAAAAAGSVETVPMSAVEELAKLQYKDLIRPPGVEEGDEEFEEDEEEERQTLKEQVEDREKGKEKATTPDSKRKPKAKQGDDDWPWKISQLGNVMLDEMLSSACDTNPDRNGVDSLASNFHAYGCVEVMERRIMKFTKELNREKMELDMVWYNLEITAYFLVSGYDYWLRTGEQADCVLRLIGAMCFAFISKLPNGAADLKQIKNTPAIFGAIFEFLKSVLSIASSYQPIINWAPTLLAILEDAGVEIWDDHQALEVARTKMGSVVEGADKLQAARQKWALGPMLSDARSVSSFGGTAHDLSKWTKAEKENGRLGPLRAKRMATGMMYTSSDDEFTEDERPSKRGKVAGKRGRGGGRARGRKKVWSYC